MKNQKGYLYILQNPKECYYIGSTIDLNNRINQHNLGLVKSTRYKRSWRLVFSKEYKNISLARKVEYKLKKFKSRKIVEKIVRDGEIKTGP